MVERLIEERVLDSAAILIYFYLQENGNTPVHLAAAQGSLDMLRLMFKMQPEKKDACLVTCDQMGMTLLHKAAMLDRTTTVEYLIEQVWSQRYILNQILIDSLLREYNSKYKS